MEAGSREVEYPRGWTALRVAILVQFAATGSVFPFITIYFGEIGLDYAHIGKILSAASATMLVFPWVWGALGDRWIPLDRLLSGLNLCAALALVGLMHARTFWPVLVTFTIYSACALPTFTLTNALAFSHLPRPVEQFGTLRSYGSLGWIIPFLPISLWLVGHRDESLAFVLRLAFGLHFLGMFCYRWVPETVPGLRRGGGIAPQFHYNQLVRERLLTINYLALLGSMFLVAGAYTVLFYYSPPFLTQLGVPREWIGPVQAIGVIVEVILFRAYRVFTRRLAVTTLILVGIVSLAVRHGLYVVGSDPWILSFSYVLAGPVIAFHHTGLGVLANTIGGREVRATAQTLFSVVGQGMGPMLSHWVASCLTARYHNSLRPVFFVAALYCVVAGILIAWRKRSLDTIRTCEEGVLEEGTDKA